jgi:hypothetical protein
VNATIAPTHPVTNRRTRRHPVAPVAAAPVAPTAPAAPAAPTEQQQQVRTLPMRVAAGVRVSAPNWMWIVGGVVVGGLLLGPIGAIAGGLAGAFLVR